MSRVTPACDVLCRRSLVPVPSEQLLGDVEQLPLPQSPRNATDKRSVEPVRHLCVREIACGPEVRDDIHVARLCDDMPLAFDAVESPATLLQHTMQELADLCTETSPR
jgi:hypothetical protein